MARRKRNLSRREIKMIRLMKEAEPSVIENAHACQIDLEAWVVPTAYTWRRNNKLGFKGYKVEDVLSGDTEIIIERIPKESKRITKVRLI